MKSELEKFYELVDDIEIAMMTTRRPDGHLRSRAMATQKRAAGADLWFVTRNDCTGSWAELGLRPAREPGVLPPGAAREWISVSGLATDLARPPERSTKLYAADWTMWFGDDGEPSHGTAKGWLTGTEPKLGEMHRLSSRAGRNA